MDSWCNPLTGYIGVFRLFDKINNPFFESKMSLSSSISMEDTDGQNITFIYLSVP